MAKILLLGAAYSEHKGASALITAVVTNLAEHIPDTQFFFCSVTPVVDRKNMHLPAVTVIPCLLKNSTLDLFLGAAWLKVMKKNPRFPMTEFLSETDVFVDISGDSYSSIYGKTALLAMALRVAAAKLLGKPIIFFCQSIGPFYGVETFFAKHILRLVDLVIAREYLTAEYLQRLDVRTSVYADQAFLLEPSPVSLPLPSKDKPLIGVNLSQLIDSKFKLEADGTNPYRKLMSEFIDQIIVRYNAHVVIIPEVKKKEVNSYDDCYVSKIIANTLRHKEHITLIDADHSPPELMSIVGNCDVLISPRFHLVIFALSANVPSLAIAYSPKTYGIMAMMGQSEFVIDYKELTLDLLLKKVEELWVNREGIEQGLRSNVVEIRTRACSAAKIVQTFIEKAKTQQRKR